MTARYFREYDLRGDADLDLPDPLVRRLGRALAAFLAPADAGLEGSREVGAAPVGTGTAPRIVVARDARRSSPRLHAALLEGLVAGGAAVFDVGLGPSPLAYFASHHLGADGCIMITASHNPPADNGFKLLRRGAPVFGPELVALAALLEGPPAAAQPGSVTTADLGEAYVAALTTDLRFGARRPRLVVDGGSGAAGPLGLLALERAGLDVVAFDCQPDGSFPHRSPDPRPEELGALRARVLAEGADAGLAWDGDGDRLTVLDRDGEPVWGDRLLALFARQVLAEQPGGVVLAEVKCSRHLLDEIARLGGRPILCRTGHSHLKARMKTEGAVLGGEMSGHIFFGDRYLGFDDALYASLRLAEILSADPRSITESLADLPQGVATPELHLPTPDADKFRLVEAVRRELAGAGELIDVDGVRVHFADGAWALVRASNTSAALGLRFEAPSKERLEAIRALVAAAIERARGALAPE